MGHRDEQTETAVHRYLMLAALLLPLSAQAVYKCTSASGQVSFQDAPCDKDTRKIERLKPSTRVNVMQAPSSLALPPMPALDLTGPPDQRYSRAHAALESMDTDGQDCVIKLRVYNLGAEALAACGRFVAQHQQWFVPVLDTMAEIAGDVSWGPANEPRLQRSLRIAERVRQHADTATLRMQSLSRR